MSRETEGTCKNGIVGCAFTDKELDLVQPDGWTLRHRKVLCRCDVKRGRSSHAKMSKLLVRQPDASDSVHMSAEEVYELAKYQPSILDDLIIAPKLTCVQQCEVCKPYCDTLLDQVMLGGTLRKSGIFCRKLAEEALAKPKSVQPWFPRTKKQKRELLKAPDSAGYSAKDRGIDSLDGLCAGRPYTTLAEVLVQGKTPTVSGVKKVHGLAILEWLDDMDRDLR